MTDPFQAPGQWLRCALHAHTTNSDGQLAPATLVRHYETAGYDVLATTDHWVRTEVPSTERLLVVPSSELNAAAGNHRDAHILAYGIAQDPVRPDQVYAPLQETVDWISAAGGVAYLAHPYWSGLRTSQFEGVEGLAGIEVYNAGCELECGRGLSAVHWDEALAGGRRIFAIAADDSHYPGFDSGFSWTWLRAAERTPAAVLTALREGAFYSSTGPEIHAVGVDGRTIEVRCSAARTVTLLCGPERGSVVSSWRLGYRYLGEVLERADNGSITAARLQAARTAPYARVEIQGAHGGTAWTNPFWF